MINCEEATGKIASSKTRELIHSANFQYFIQVSTKEFFAAEKVHFLCFRNKVLRGKSVAVCKQSGEWSAYTPFCK